MIAGLGSVAVLVSDASKAARWYRRKLGFEVFQDEGHLLFVRPKGSATLLHLCGRCHAWETDGPGGRTGLWLRCGRVSKRKDPKSGLFVLARVPRGVEKTYLDLKRKGVDFSEELTSAGWGSFAVLKDPYGNMFEIS